MMIGNYTEIWSEIKEYTELISGNKVIKYSKNFMKIKFESNDDFSLGKIINIPVSLGKIINIPVCAIIVRGVFEEDSKLYRQIFLNESFYEL